MLQKIVAQIIDQVLTRLGVDKRLDELRDKAFQEIEETRDKALAMFKDSLPQMAGAVSQAAVSAVFDHTQIDETTDHVTDVFNNILNRLPFGIGQQP